ncbi:MAG TPA: hypothetical protein VF013_00705 [Candidatus Limnocylindria bacterium]
MPADDTLKRQSAGLYATPDGRFRVSASDGLWYLTDTDHTDELGQPRLSGPYGTLAEARDAIAGLRRQAAKD